jgi:hypothetical protein
MSMKRTDSKKLVVRVGKKELRSVRDQDLDQVSGGMPPRPPPSPPPTASGE